MLANHSDCRYAIRGDPVLVAGTQYTTLRFLGDEPLEEVFLSVLLRNVMHVGYRRPADGSILCLFQGRKTEI